MDNNFTPENTPNTPSPEKKKEPKITGAEKEQRGLFKKKRGGVVLTRDQVKEIKEGRKKLRKEMRARGIKSRKEFELTASSLGLYFDKRRLPFLLWFSGGRGLWALLGALMLLFAGLYLFSMITQLRGHFTINMTNEMFKEGFSLSDKEDFEQPTSYLFGDKVYNIPCTSIAMLPKGLDDVDGTHNGPNYFAYTFYIKNEGDTTVGYEYALRLNSESKQVASATWLMLFEDGQMQLFAHESASGGEEALPPFGDNTRGYHTAPYIEVAADSISQFQTIAVTEHYSFYRIVPFIFESDSVVTTGRQSGVAPQEVHKYTVVIWIEGDDPECTNDIIGGHVGFQMDFKLISETVSNFN